MKTLRVALLVLLVAVAAFPESKSLGMGAFSNEDGAILLAVDASLVSRTLDNPYVMFYAYMAGKDNNQKVAVAAKEIVVVYNGIEYSLPTVRELRDNYDGIIKDYSLYSHLGKEGIMASWAWKYQFPSRAHFFPSTEMRADLAADSGHMYGIYGFQTPLYVKNPGFVKGDKVTFKVRDMKNPNLTGECTVIL